LAWFLRAVLAYFLVAIIVAFIGAPLLKWINKKIHYKGKSLPSWLSASVVLIVFVSIVCGFIYMIIPPLIEQTTAISKINSADFNRSFAQPLNDLKTKLSHWGIATENINPQFIEKKIKDYLSFTTLSDIAGKVVSSVSATTGWVFSVLFISFFFLKDKFLIYRLFYILTPDKYEPRMQRVMRGLNNMLGRYFRSVFLQMLVFGSYIFVGLSIAGEKNALTIAVFSGFINLVSYIGPLLGISFALLFCILSNIGADFYGVMLNQMYHVVIVYVIAVLLDNFFSYPLIFSKSLKVHPLELFFVILAGAQLGGLGGMMLAAPVYTVIRIIAKEFLSGFEIVQSVTKNI
jgi:predicted PurR-regulated permease PerM